MPCTARKFDVIGSIFFAVQPPAVGLYIFWYYVVHNFLTKVV
jgi:hypothetical protein